MGMHLSQGWLRYFDHFTTLTGCPKAIPSICVYPRCNEDNVKDAMVTIIKPDSKRICVDPFLLGGVPQCPRLALVTIYTLMDTTSQNSQRVSRIQQDLRHVAQ